MTCVVSGWKPLNFGYIMPYYKVLYAPFAMEIAVRSGHLEAVQWLYENRPNELVDYPAIVMAAGAGYLDVVIWLHENTTSECSEHAMELAAQYDHLDVVKWLYENREEGCSARIMKTKSRRVINFLQSVYPNDGYGPGLGKSIGWRVKVAR